MKKNKRKHSKEEKNKHALNHLIENSYYLSDYLLLDTKSSGVIFDP